MLSDTFALAAGVSDLRMQYDQALSHMHLIASLLSLSQSFLIPFMHFL